MEIGEQLYHLHAILPEAHDADGFHTIEKHGLYLIYSLATSEEELWKDLKEDYQEHGATGITIVEGSLYATLQNLWLKLVNKDQVFIPLPFGSLFNSVEDLEYWVNENTSAIQSIFRTDLEKPFPKQYHINFSLKTDSLSKHSHESGKSYFMAKYAIHQAKEKFENALPTFLEQLNSCFSNPVVGREGKMQLCLLVTSKEEEKLQKLCLKFLEEHRKLHIKLTGPWPPYLLAKKLGQIPIHKPLTL